MFLEIGRIICDPVGVVFYFHTDFAIIIGILRILDHNFLQKIIADKFY